MLEQGQPHPPRLFRDLRHPQPLVAGRFLDGSNDLRERHGGVMHRRLRGQDVGLHESAASFDERGERRGREGGRWD